MNFGSYWFSDKIVLQDVPRAGGRRRASALHDGRAAVAPGAAADAEGLHHSGSVAERVRDRAEPVARRGGGDRRASSRCSSEHELEGVIAHELAHVKNRDILISSVAATMAAAIMMAAHMAQYAAMFGGYGGRGDDRDRGNNPIALLAMIILAPIAAMLIQMAISRSREFAADADRRADRRQSRTASPTRCGRSRRWPSGCRSTPTRPRRTCSS